MASIDHSKFFLLAITAAVHCVYLCTSAVFKAKYKDVRNVG